MSKIKILLFAAAADIAGKSSLWVDYVPGDSLADLANRLTVEHPEIAGLLAASRWAVNREFVTLVKGIQPQDELAIIPPVSGG